MTGAVGLRDRYAALVAREAEGGDPYEDRGLSVGIVLVGVLAGAFFGAHQVGATGFLAASFGVPEGVALYGTLAYWIATALLVVTGRKQASRDLDLPGLFLAAVALAWLLAVFPFDLARLGAVVPPFAAFAVGWIGDGVARGLLALLVVVHLVLAVTSGTLRLSVYRVRGEGRRVRG